MLFIKHKIIEDKLTRQEARCLDLKERFLRLEIEEVGKHIEKQVGAFVKKACDESVNPYDFLPDNEDSLNNRNNSNFLSSTSPRAGSGLFDNLPNTKTAAESSKHSHFSKDLNSAKFLQSSPQSSASSSTLTLIPDQIYISKECRMDELKTLANYSQAYVKETTKILNLDDITDCSSDEEDVVELFKQRMDRKEKDEEQEDPEIQRLAEYVPIHENPYAKWAKDRAKIGSRWKWLINQIESIDFLLKKKEVYLNYFKDKKPKIELALESNTHHLPVRSNTPLKTAYVNYYNVVPSAPSGIINNLGLNDLNKQSPNSSYSEQILMSSSSTVPPSSPLLKQEISNGKIYSVIPSESNSNEKGGGLETLKLRVASIDDPTCVAQRCLALKPLKRRKMFQISGIHNLFPHKRTPTLRCHCSSNYRDKELCIVCTGRALNKKPIDHVLMKRPEVMALLDHNYHKAISLPEEQSLRILLENGLTDENYEEKSWSKKKKGVKDNFVRTVLLPSTSLRTIFPPKSEEISQNQVKKKGRGPGRPPVNKRRFKKKSLEKDYGDLSDASDGSNGSWSGKNALRKNEKKRLQQAYDIDNIVIPYSIAATTRVEQIKYKEIITPNWREVEVEPKPKIIKEKETSEVAKEEESEWEDISDEAIAERHERNAKIEAKKLQEFYDRQRKKRIRTRMDSKAEHSDTNTQENSTKSEKGSSTPHQNHQEMDTSSPVPNSSSFDDPNSNAGTPISVAEALSAVSAVKCTSSTSPMPFQSRRKRTSSKRLENISDEETEMDWGSEIHIKKKPVVFFERRTFPLDDNIYDCMKKEMADYVIDSDSDIEEKDKTKDSSIASTSASASSSKPETSLSFRKVDMELYSHPPEIPSLSIKNLPKNKDKVEKMELEEDTEEKNPIKVGKDEEDPNDPDWIESE